MDMLHKYTKGYYVINLFFCSTLFPFVSPYPIGTDTQPIACILATLIIGLQLVERPKLRWSELGLLLFPILLLCYANPLAVHLIPKQIGKYFSLLAGVVVYVAAKRVYHLFSPKVFYYTIIIYFVVTLIYWFSPAIMHKFQPFFVREVRSADGFVYRGIPTFSTEPGLFGGTLIYFFLMLEYFNKKSVYTIRQNITMICMLIFMIAMTKSGTGYLYFFIYMLCRLAGKISNKTGLLYFSVSVGIIYGIFFSMNLIHSLPGTGRGFQVMYVIITNPKDIVLDTSIIGRLYDFFMGPLSLLHFPFGVGANDVDTATRYMTANYLFLKKYFGVTSVGLVSGIAWCLIAYGIFAAIYLYYIYFYNSGAGYRARFFSFLFFAISYSPAFPGIWMLLAQPNSRKIKAIRTTATQTVYPQVTSELTT